MSAQQKTRFELVLDFDRPVSILKARETARKLVDHLKVSVDGFEAPTELGEASLRSAELKRVIRLSIPETNQVPAPEGPLAHFD